MTAAASGSSYPRRSRRAQVGAVLAPAAWLALTLLPLPLPASAARLCPIVAAVLVAWVTEVVPIPVTALLIAPAMVLAGVTDAKTAFSPYAAPILYVFVGGFLIARAMQRHGLDRRVAQAVIALPVVGNSSARTRAALMVTAMLLSMWISNTATSAILLPIALGTLPDPEATDERSTTLLLSVAYAASVGGLGTPVGSPPNLITMRMLENAGVHLSFLQWMALGVPVSLLLGAGIFAYFQWRAPTRTDASAPDRPEPRALSRGERVTTLAFMLAVAGWLGPGIAEALSLPSAPWLEAHLPAGAVALLAASVLFLFRDERGEQPVLPWEDAVQIDWGLVVLFGGGMSLGNQMFDTGLALALGEAFIEGTGVQDVWVLTAVATLLCLLLTEACSNMATANMLVPLVIGVAEALGVSPLGPALGVGIAASCAFMLPIATGPNAIVYGTGKVSVTAMMRHGAVLNGLCVVLIVAYVRLVCLWLAP